MLRTTAPYRRDDQASLPVPVVMPLVEITIDEDGRLEVLLGHEPYSADGALHRADLRRVVGDIAADLNTPVRVEVREASGTTFTDIITPSSVIPVPAERLRIAESKIGEVGGDGFLPNEDVAVAVVVAHQIASDDGTARLRLPPALLAAHPGLVVLIGQTSGTLMASGGAA